MSKFRVGIIGCGRPGRAPGSTGAGMAHYHVKGYLASADCELVAAADIVQDNVDAFCDQYHIPPLGENWQGMGIYESVPTTKLNAHRVRAYAVEANWRWFRNSMGCCAFLPWSRDQHVRLVRTITGWETNVYEMLKWRERGVTMGRAFNMREGLTRADDVLPPRTRMPHASGSLNESRWTPRCWMRRWASITG